MNSTLALPPTERLELDWNDRTVRLEYQWIQAVREDAPLLVFLHEGLGSVAMWKAWPARLCADLGCRGLVYSRPGYGRSTPRQAEECWAPDFMHKQAWEVLPALLEALGVQDRKPVLVGHSDGASIALLHAARYSAALSGVVVIAPHLFVEEVSVRSIAAARWAYEEGGLRARLAPYHEDVDSAFWGWNRIWLDPAFRGWNIEADMPGIDCPVLAIQGEDDEYGTLRQIDRLQEQVPRAQSRVLAQCGHSPHRDQPEQVGHHIARFLQENVH